VSTTLSKICPSTGRDLDRWVVPVDVESGSVAQLPASSLLRV
jgi:hypothetical protein